MHLQTSQTTNNQPTHPQLCYSLPEDTRVVQQQTVTIPQPPEMGSKVVVRLSVIAVYRSARTAIPALLLLTGPSLDSTQSLPIGPLLRRLGAAAAPIASRNTKPISCPDVLE